jgi:hypothetical protein
MVLLLSEERDADEWRNGFREGPEIDPELPLAFVHEINPT